MLIILVLLFDIQSSGCQFISNSEDHKVLWSQLITTRYYQIRHFIEIAIYS